MTEQGTESEYAIENGWLVELVREHTCGAGPGSGAGHEPGCGMIPIATVENLLAENERLRAGLYPLSQFTPESSAALADDIGASEDSLFVGWIRRGSEIEAANTRIASALAELDRYATALDPSRIMPRIRAILTIEATS